jgi:hypothetical protein
MRRRVIRSLLATAVALGTAAACGARDDGVDVEFDPGAGGNLGTGAISGSSGRGGGGSFGRGGALGSDGVGGAFGSDGVGGAFGTAGAFGSAGTFGSGGTFGAAGTGGSVGPDGSVGRGGSSGRGGSGRGGTAGFPDGGLPDGSIPDASFPDSGREDCMNGRDDDGDNLLDCADPDCSAGFVCTPPAPAGWLGPAALWQGTDVPPFRLCPDNGYQQGLGGGWTGIIAEPALCADCTCSAPEGASCATANLSFGNPGTCGGLTLPTTILANVCQSFRLRLDARSVGWDSAPATGGACQSGTDGDSTLPPVRWSRYAAACYNPRPGGGCSSGGCLPRPAAPFGGGICITQTGDLACPSPYTERFLYYGGLLDNRSCTACSCASPSGATCSGSVLLGSDAICSADRITLSRLGSCADLGPDPTPPEPPAQQSRSAYYTGSVANRGTCAPSGGAPIGSAEATNPITYCCTPPPSRGRFRIPPRPRPLDAGAD